MPPTKAKKKIPSGARKKGEPSRRKLINPTKGKKQGTGNRTNKRDGTKSIPLEVGQKDRNAEELSIPLTDLRRRFVEEYVVDCNATDAARRSGYSCPVIGAQLLKEPLVAEAVLAAMAKRRERTEASADKTLRELASLAYADPGDVFEPDGVTLRSLSTMPISSRHTISSIKVKRFLDPKKGPGELVSITFWDKNKALQMIGKHQGLKVDTDGSFIFVDQLNLTINPPADYSKLPTPLLENLLAWMEESGIESLAMPSLGKPAPKVIEAISSPESGTGRKEGA